MAWRKPKQEQLIVQPTIETLPKKQIVPEFIKIEKMSIRYIQPYPPPDFIKFFQSLNHEDVDFIRIPVSKNTDALYLRKSISKLLIHLTGIHWDRIEGLIKKYNDESENSSSARDPLLNIMNLATYFSDKDGIEFLTDA